METIKKILRFIIEPFHRFGSQGLTDKATKQVAKNRYIEYVVALVVTIVIVVVLYFF